MLKKDGDTQYCVFACDTKDELSDFPTTTRGGTGSLKGNYSFHYAVALGSIAYVGSNNATYRLFSDGWHITNSGSGSGGSGGGSSEVPNDWEFATNEDIDNLFK